MKLFNASCELDSNQEQATFRIVANAGSRMSFEDGDVIVDLEGDITPRAQDGIIPIIDGHNRDSLHAIGQASKISVENGAIILEGVVTCDNERARNFVSSSKKGFPWQASIGFTILDGVNVPKNEEIEVNGRNEKGAVFIATAIEIWECSVVLFGADSNTSAVFAKANDMADNIDTEKLVSTSECEVQASEQDELKALREARAQESERIEQIEKLANEYNTREYVAQAIREGWTATKFELETLRASRSQAPALHCKTENVDIKAVEVAFLRAAGLQPNERKYSDQILTAADSLKYSDFRDLVECASGYKPTAEERRNARAWCQAASAISTNNLGSVLTTSANAVLLESFNYYPQNWREVFKVSSVNDFKAAERYRVSSNFEFKETPEGGEFEHGEQADEKWTIQAKTYGRQYVLGYQSIVNGEALGVFGDIMRQIAFGASTALNKACWTLLLNPAQVDSKNFYSSDYGTLKTSSPLTLENLSAARAAFVTKKRAKGVDADEILGIAPSVLLVPTSLEDKALMLTKATTLNNGASGDNPADYNPNLGRFRVVATPELENASYTGYSASAWYLLADPRSIAAFEIAFLNGIQTPTVRSGDIEIGQLGIKFDGYLGFGVAQEDYRGILKATA